MDSADKVKYERVAKSVLYLVVDIENETTRRFEDAIDLMNQREYPFHIVIGRNTLELTIGFEVGVRRAGDDKVNAIVLECLDELEAISLHLWIDAKIPTKGGRESVLA